MRFHIVSLPHTEVTRGYDVCAYTAKIRRFVGMMSSLGHEVFLYAGDKTDPNLVLAEDVPIVTGEDRLRWFGHEEWPVQEVFNYWDVNHPSWVQMNERAIKEINARFQPGDFVGLISGLCQGSIYREFKKRTNVVEWGIGYSGTVSDLRVFESYAWMHHVAGLQRDDNIHYFDAVIPNSFDDGDFTPSTDVGEYLLYLGRPTVRKGLDIIRAIAKNTSVPIVTAGQGPPWLDGADHRGVVLGVEKAKLLSGALALLSPSVYLEPFGGVHVEARLSGTPVITTDYGVYTETVENGLDGYRCRTLKDFMTAVEKSPFVDRREVRRRAEKFLTTNVRYQYESYFETLSTLWGDGWSAL